MGGHWFCIPKSSPFRLRVSPLIFGTLFAITNLSNTQNMSERKLASIRIVSNIQSIPDADAIDVATVDSWKLVVKKGELSIGCKAIYCEIDSFLPICDEFEFLRSNSFKIMGEIEGFRLRTKTMRGQISQGLLLPMSFLDGKVENYEDLPVGYDVTDVLGIIKYERPIPKEMEGKMRAGYPSRIPSTSLERIQNMTKDYSALKEKTYFEQEKMNGYSTTYYLMDNFFSVCTKDVDLLETEDCPYWKFARENDLDNKMKLVGYNIALQAEFIGEGIMKNPYKLKGKTARFFKAFNIDAYEYLDYGKFTLLMKSLGLETVPMKENFMLPETIDELLLMANGASALNQNAKREGLVIYSHDMTVSFKVISNQMLLKED